MDNNIKNKILKDKILQQILPVLQKYNTYLVGGYLRDLFLNMTTNDRDIVVFDKPAIEVAQEIQQITNGFFVELDSENEIYRIIVPNKIDYIDVAKGVGASIYDDLKRRDFSINAIALDLKSFEIIDITNGINDINNKIIKLISEKNLFDDALRMIRVARFEAKLGFKIDDKIFDLVKQNINLLDDIAKERINYELLKIFESKYTTEALLSLNKMALIDKLLPEMIKVKTIPTNSHHHLPLFYHCLETVKQVQIQIDKSDEKIKEYFEKNNLGAHKRLAYLKFAAFIHDVGKPLTWTIEPESGRHRFIKHDEVGSQIIVKTLKNLKFSNKQIKYLQTLIKYHIYPSALMSEENNEKALNRYFRKMEDNSLDIIYIAMADRLSARGEAITDEMVEKNILHLTNMINFYFNNFLNQKPLEKLLDGNEIMEILNIEKSPTLGKIIKSLKEAQINSDVVTKADAIKFIKELDYQNL